MEASLLCPARRKPRSAKRQDLIEKFRFLPLHIVNKLRIRGRLCNLDPDDAIQVGQVALIRAADHFDFSRGVQFSTYAYRCIFWGILTEIRREGKWSAGGNCDPQTTGWTEEAVMEDIGSHIALKEDFVSAASMMWRACMNTEDFIAVLLKYGCPGLLLEEIGKIMGVSKERVRQRVDRLMKAVK